MHDFTNNANNLIHIWKWLVVLFSVKYVYDYIVKLVWWSDTLQMEKVTYLWKMHTPWNIHTGQFLMKIPFLNIIQGLMDLGLLKRIDDGRDHTARIRNCEDAM